MSEAREAVTARPRRRPDPDEAAEVEGREYDEDIEDFDEEGYEQPRRRRRARRHRRSSSGARRFSRSALRRVAMLQRGILACILLSVCTLVISMALPGESALLRLGVSLLAAAACAVCVLLLSLELYGHALGALLGGLALIPYIGLIPLLIVNGKATGTLREHGYHVGFLGANLSQFDR